MAYRINTFILAKYSLETFRSLRMYRHRKSKYTLAVIS